MRIFIAGATGVIGRPLVKQLVGRGHEVIGTTRFAHRVPLLEAAGARAVLVDAFDLFTLREAVRDAAPEVLVHMLTSIPRVIDFRRYGEQFTDTNRLRTVGTANLLEAARAGGVRRIVAQSIAFAYEPGDGNPRTEEDPLVTHAPRAVQEGVNAVIDLERQVTRTPGVEGVVLRYGYFYGPGTAYALDGSIADLVRRGSLAVVGRGQGVFPFVHIDDAVTATVAAIEAQTTGVFNVVDDDPAPLAAWLPEYARVIGARPPRRVPTLIARLAAGELAVWAATSGVPVSNARAKQELEWRLRYPSWRRGFTQAIEAERRQRPLAA